MKYNIDTQFYPGWTRKAITFTIDDGVLDMDRKFMDILGPAGIRGTFNLCSHKLGNMTPEQYREFYKGYEIANHCKYHPYLFMEGTDYKISTDTFDAKTADPEFLYPTEVGHLYHVHMPKGWRLIADAEGYVRFVGECHKELEEVFGKGSVRSFVWPFDRRPNTVVDEHLSKMGYYGIRRSFLWGENEGFLLPPNWMLWGWTAGHRNFLEVAEKYEAEADDGNLKFFCLGVHSIDYEREQKWEDLRTFARTYGYRPQDYYYATVGEIYDYQDALKQIIITEDGVKNPTKLDLYIRIDGENTILKAGEALCL